MPGPGSVATSKVTPKRKGVSERTVIARVKALVKARDGYCRVGSATTYLGACEGISEWCHLEEFRRFKTRGMEPERRHSCAGTAYLCQKHHRAYDDRVFTVEFLTSKGADDTIRLRKAGLSVLSVARGEL